MLAVGAANATHTPHVSAVECISQVNCDDGNACNGAETCDASGTCVQGSGLPLGSACALVGSTMGVCNADQICGEIRCVFALTERQWDATVTRIVWIATPAMAQKPVWQACVSRGRLQLWVGD